MSAIDPTVMHDPRIADLRDALRRLGPLIDEDIVIPGTDRLVRVARPLDTDLLLETAAGDPEQNLPYWAELWPSGIALGAAIAASPHDVRDRRVLEIGCGLGVTAAVALEAGADLLATDYSADSLALTALTCLRTTGRPVATARVNWRDTADPILTSIDRFPVLIAADVLYEQRDIEPLLAFIERKLAPGGLLWLAEPERRPAGEFLARVANRGWVIHTERHAGPWPDPKDKDVVVRIHRIHPHGTPMTP